MRPVRFAFVIVALGCAGVSLFLAQTFLSSKPSKAVIVEQKTIAPAPIAIPQQKVLVAARDFQVGQTLKSSDFQWQDWPQEFIGQQYITKSQLPNAMNEMQGMIVKSSIMQGEPITERKIAHLGDKGMMSLLLRKGMRAISVGISPETGAGGFILPGDRVDVVLTRRYSKQPPVTDMNAVKSQSSSSQPPQATPVEGIATVAVVPAGTNISDTAIKPVTAIGEGYFTETILTNVRVLAVDQAVQDEKSQGSKVGRTATLEVVPNQAEVIALASKIGEISLMLRSLADVANSEEEDSEKSLPKLVGQLGRPDLVNLPTNKAENTVRMIRGASRSQTTVFKTEQPVTPDSVADTENSPSSDPSSSQ